ncbi:hypothetical protein NpNSSI1_00012337 [Neofusicoccum parvum]|nr:hypothetical protein NpNSSI1_00012337 [Neofusicoccum parvum]
MTEHLSSNVVNYPVWRYLQEAEALPSALWGDDIWKRPIHGPFREVRQHPGKEDLAWGGHGPIGGCDLAMATPKKRGRKSAWAQPPQTDPRHPRIFQSMAGYPAQQQPQPNEAVAGQNKKSHLRGPNGRPRTTNPVAVIVSALAMSTIAIAAAMRCASCCGRFAVGRVQVPHPRAPRPQGPTAADHWFNRHPDRRTGRQPPKLGWCDLPRQSNLPALAADGVPWGWTSQG